MNKFVVLSFVFMGFAFYELSGGEDFVPRKAEMIAAAKAEAAEKAKAREARLAYVQPERVAPPEPVTEVAVRAAPKPVTAPEPTVRTVETAASQTPAVTLASLESSPELFETSVIQLSAAPETALTPEVTETPEPLDIRQVAGTRVNMRVGPGTAYNVLTSLPQGTAVEIIDADGAGWVKLRTVEDEMVGWMAEYLLTEPTG